MVGSSFQSRCLFCVLTDRRGQLSSPITMNLAICCVSVFSPLTALILVVPSMLTEGLEPLLFPSYRWGSRVPGRVVVSLKLCSLLLVPALVLTAPVSQSGACSFVSGKQWEVAQLTPEMRSGTFLRKGAPHSFQFSGGSYEKSYVTCCMGQPIFLTYLFHEYVLSSRHVPGSVLDTRDKVVSKTDRTSVLATITEQ